MSRPILALDADGVLVDLHMGFARAWERAFGAFPEERDPQAYWPQQRWDVPPLDAEQRLQLRAHFDETLWESLPAIAGALEACHRLHDAGHELVCVTALDDRFRKARLRNLRSLGFPIDRVLATGHVEGPRSPKADAIESLRPVAFVDDYVAYLRGVPPTCTRRWCCARPTAARTSVKNWPWRAPCTRTWPTSPTTGSALGAEPAGRAMSLLWWIAGAAPQAHHRFAGWAPDPPGDEA